MFLSWIARYRSVGWLAAIVVVATWAGCTGRERGNPFDPLNPDTGGEPAVAWALADCDRVTLSWRDLGISDLAGYRIWRDAWQADGAAQEERAPGELLTTAQLPVGTETFADTTAANGQAYVYRVEFCFEPDSSSAFCAPVEARPGAAQAWSGDACGWGLALLAPDAGGVERIEAFGSAVLDLDIDPSGARLYAAQIDSGQVLIYRPDGERLGALEVAGASCVSWSPDAGALAVGAFYERLVHWLTPEGEVLWTLELGEDQHPEDVSFRDRSTTWIALREGQLLRADLAAARAETLAVSFDRPVAIADDPGRGCWVADRGGDLVYVADDGSSVRAAEGQFDEPLDLDADGAGECWVADLGRGSLLRIDRQAQVVREIPAISGAAGVTYDPEADALWVALPERGEVLFHALARSSHLCEVESQDN